MIASPSSATLTTVAATHSPVLLSDRSSIEVFGWMFAVVPCIIDGSALGIKFLPSTAVI